VEARNEKLKVTVAKHAVPGVYWLRAYNPDGASSPRPFIVGTIPEAMETEPNDEPKKAQVLEGSSVVVNGKLSKTGDVDCFAVRLKKGETLVASLVAHHTLRSPMDAMLQIVSADGFVLDENNDFHGLDPQIAFTAKKDGAYIARVYAFPASPDASIRFFGSEACIYRLTLATGPFADFVVPLASSDTKSHPVEIEGWNIKPGPHPITIATELPDDPLATVFGADLVNTFRIRVEPHSTFGVKHSEPLKPPFSATGRVDKAAGEARIRLVGKKGQALTVQVESRSLGLAVNPLVRVLDAEGQELGKAEPANLNSDTTLNFTPAVDGTYSLAVRDLFGGGGPRFAFLVRVLSEPDYDLTVGTDRFTITPGKPTTVPVKVNRKLGFKNEVDVGVEGLPAGVKFEVTKPAKPDPSTVTISLSADKPVSGAFRLVGTVKDEPKLKRHARAPLAEFDETTADLWVTVLAPPKK
jgi:hypothetical protein